MPRLVDHQVRREQLAEAAWRVILRDGVTGASVRNVATEAGLSVGSLRYFFATQSELLVFALQLVIDRVRARVAQLPERPRGLAMVEEVAVQFLPLDVERRAEMAVYLSLFSAANADTGLRGPCQQAYRELRDACRWMVTEIWGEAHADDVDGVEREAVRLHAVIDGLALHLLYEPDDADPAWARDALLRHLRGLAGPRPILAG